MSSFLNAAGRVLKENVRNLRNAPSGILAVGWTTLLVAISTGAFYSISPFYLKEVLGISVLSIGLLEQCTEAFSHLCRLFSGVISDYLKRSKPMFLLGTFFSALARPFFIFANGFGMIIASKTLDRLGNGISATPRDSYTAQHSSPEQKGANIGLVMTFKTLGCVIGPCAVGLFTGICSWKTLIIASSIPSFLAVFVSWFYMKEGRTQKEDVQHKVASQDNRNSFSLRQIVFLPRMYWMFLLVMMLFMLARVQESYMLLSLKETGLPLAFCTSTIGFFNAVSVLVSYPMGRLSDRFGRLNVLFFSFASLLVSLFCFSTSSKVCGVIGVLSWGIQRSTSQILSVACISDMVSPKIVGTAIGMLNLLICLSNLVSVYFYGKIVEHFDFYRAYQVSVLVSLLSLIVLFIFSKISASHKKMPI